MRFIVVIGTLCWAISSSAQVVQTSGFPAGERDSVRAYYIKNFPDYFFLYPVLKQRSLNFELEKRKNGDGLVSYKPNNAYSFGIGMYLFELVFELAFAVPLDERSQAQYGKSKARDIQLNLIGKKWGADAFYQKYSGFYATGSNINVTPDGKYPQRPDIVSRNIGLTGNYIFNNQRFSFRSAYNFAERQVFSKGSALVFSTISSFKMDADSSILNNAQEQTFGNELSFTNLQYTTFSVAPGYTYSVVYQNFFLNGTLAVGPAHHWINYKLESDIEKNETAINSFVVARIGLGYNGPRIFGGISFLTQGSNVNFADTRFSNNNGAFKILVGYRFREFGFLKKRVWDLIPFKL